MRITNDRTKEMFPAIGFTHALMARKSPPLFPPPRPSFSFSGGNNGFLPWGAVVNPCITPFLRWNEKMRRYNSIFGSVDPRLVDPRSGAPRGRGRVRHGIVSSPDG